MTTTRQVTWPQYPSRNGGDQAMWTVWQNVQYLANQLVAGIVISVPIIPFGRGADITAANSISVTNQVHNVNGVTTIKNILGATDGAVVTLRAQSSILNFDSTGNILATGAGGTRAVPQGAAITLVFNGTTWMVSGVGS